MKDNNKENQLKFRQQQKTLAKQFQCKRKSTMQVSAPRHTHNTKTKPHIHKPHTEIHTNTATYDNYVQSNKSNGVHPYT